MVTRAARPLNRIAAVKSLAVSAPTAASRARLAVLAGTVLLLAACGGGGADAEPVAGSPPSPAPSPTPAPTPAPSPAPSPSPTPSPTPSPSPTPAPATATCGLASFQAELLQRVNAARAAGATCGSTAYAAAGALGWNAALANAAAAHSQDMVTNNFFSHTGSTGSNPGTRLTAAGYTWRTYGENIAAGYGSVDAVMAGWMASPGHCANIMGAAFREIGVACIRGTAGNAYPTYWTMTLGAQR